MAGPRHCRLLRLLCSLYTAASGACYVGCAARSIPVRSRPILCAAVPPVQGHVFVIQGDVTRLSADATLYPTRAIDDTKWFPNGPPEGAESIDPALFTPDRRVIMTKGTSSLTPTAWLSDLIWDGEGTPPIEWFTEAAEAYLSLAYSHCTREGASPLCSRQLPLLALPVLGTGSSGAKPITGTLLSALLLLLMRFVANHAVDVVLVGPSPG